MKITRRQLNILIESLLYETGPYAYMSSPEDLEKLGLDKDLEIPGVNKPTDTSMLTRIPDDIEHKIKSLDSVEDVYKESELASVFEVFGGMFLGGVGLGLALLKSVPLLIGVGVAVASGALSVKSAYEKIINMRLKNKKLFDQVPENIAKLLDIDDEVLELINDDLVEYLPTLYTDNVLLPAKEKGEMNLDEVMSISEFLDKYLKDNSNNQLGKKKK